MFQMHLYLKLQSVEVHNYFPYFQLTLLVRFYMWYPFPYFV